MLCHAVPRSSCDLKATCICSQWCDCSIPQLHTTTVVKLKAWMKANGLDVARGQRKADLIASIESHITSMV